MNHLICPRAICTSIAFSIFGVSASAAVLMQQLRQPESVLPWVAPAKQAAKPLPSLAAVSAEPLVMPHWMAGAVPQTVAVRVPRRFALPQVETDHFANLGEIPAGPAHRGQGQSPVAISGGPVVRNALVAPPMRFFRGVR